MILYYPEGVVPLCKPLGNHQATKPNEVARQNHLFFLFRRLTMDAIKSFFEGIFGAAAGFVMITLMLCYSIGTIYWMWIAIQVGSFWMFVLGFMPPTMVFTGLIGGYSMIFGTPDWVFNMFG